MMENVGQIIYNHMLISAVLAWLIAQILKTIIHAITNHALDASRFLGNGGMPSSHSATVAALAWTAGWDNGFASPIFAIALVLAIIVVKDAAGVRLETQKQTEVIGQIVDRINESGENELTPRVRLKKHVGHTPPQIAAGLALGIAVSAVYCRLVH